MPLKKTGRLGERVQQGPEAGLQDPLIPAAPDGTRSSGSGRGATAPAPAAGRAGSVLPTPFRNAVLQPAGGGEGPPTLPAAKKAGGLLRDKHGV